MFELLSEPKWIVIMVIGLLLIWDSFFVIKQRTAGIIERLGKFNKICHAGLNFKIPFFDRLVTKVNLKIENKQFWFFKNTEKRCCSRAWRNRKTYFKTSI